jgi:hypothetical protein
MDKFLGENWGIALTKNGGLILFLIFGEKYFL